MRSWYRFNLLRRDASWWFSRMRSDAKRDSDARRFLSWLNSDESNAHHMEMMEMVWRLSGELKSDNAVNRVLPLTRPIGSRHPIRRALLAASLVVVTVCASLQFWRLSTSETAFTTLVGEQKEYELPDGSQVFLNTASSIRIRYSGLHRAVFLDHGEAMFSVTKDRWRPFVVNTKFGTATALGTRFDVFLRPSSVQVVIVDGTVGLQPAISSAGESSRIARSGELAVIDASAHVLIGRADLAPILDKRVQHLDFDRVTIADAVAEFNQYSLVALQYDPSIANLKFSGVFKVGDNQAFADSLKATLNLTSTSRNGQTILIKR